jgi:hypothetical protein
MCSVPAARMPLGSPDEPLIETCRLRKAPRHSHIPSESGMRALVERADLQIMNSFYDSTEFGFLGQ